MRLIDADVLKKDLTRFYENEVTAKQLIDEQPTVEPQRWIPCSKRLPEPVVSSQIRGWFITSNQYGCVTVTRYEFEASVFKKGWQTDMTDMTILAWMPLPEPYKPNNFSQHMNPPED